MKTNTAPYLVQRQPDLDGDWMPVTHCESLAYAELIAATGMQHGLAPFYRAIELQTGTVTRLAPTLTRAPSDPRFTARS